MKDIHEPWKMCYALSIGNLKDSPEVFRRDGSIPKQAYRLAGATDPRPNQSWMQLTLKHLSLNYFVKSI